MRRRRRELLAGAVVALVAVLAWALAPSYPSYDSQWALVWGRELVHGVLPSYEVYAAPTPHPLWTLVAGACALLGGGGDRALVLVAVGSLVALAWGVARLGAGVWDAPRGLLAAVLVGTSTSLGLYAAKAFVDVPFAALVAWAGALEVERARAGRPAGLGPPALLAVAGLLRPEGWLLALALWAWRRGWRSASLTGLAFLAPLLWGLADLAVTGDPLFSLHRTSLVVESIGEQVSAGEVPRALVSFLAAVLRPPVLVLGVLGVGLALWRGRARPPRALGVPLALLAVGIAAFVAGAVLALTAQQRYLTVPAVALGLFAAHALLGFRDEAPGAVRTWWARGAAGAAVLALVAGVVLLPGTAGRLRTELRFVRDSHSALAAVLAVARVRGCRPIVMPTYKGVPDALWILGAPPGVVVAAPALGPRRPGARIIVGPGDRVIRRFGRAAGVPATTDVLDPDVPILARRGAFTAQGRCT